MKDWKNSLNNWTYHDTKLLLKKYRDIVWNIENRVCEVETEYDVLGSNRLAEVLDYLDDYASCNEKKKLEARVFSLHKSRWLIEIVDKALLKVKSYPENGECYYNILYHQYISEHKYSENEMLELLEVERSTLYKKKREALQVMSLVLWGDLQ